MAPARVPAQKVNQLNGLLSTLAVAYKITTKLRNRLEAPESPDAKLFHDVEARFLQFKDYIGRKMVAYSKDKETEKQLWKRFDRKLIRTLTAELKAIITVREHNDGSPEAIFRSLRHGWKRSSQDEHTQNLFMDSCFTFSQDPSKAKVFLDSVMSLDTDPNDTSDDNSSVASGPTMDLDLSDKDGNPSPTSDAARAIFKAKAFSPSKCGCEPSHGFDARLRLGTYYEPELDGTVPYQNTAVGKSKLAFDMFLNLSADDDWRQVKVYVERGVEVSMGQDLSEQHRRRVLREIGKKMPEECVRGWMVDSQYSIELKLMVQQNKLFQLQRAIASEIDFTKEPLSLYQVFEIYSSNLFFTTKMKRILSVLLSYAVWHLNDTPWLQRTWTSSDILFYPKRTKGSEIALTPFLRLNISATEHRDLVLVDEARQRGQNRDTPEGANHALADDDYYRWPSLFMLAILLLEIHFAQPFHILMNHYTPKIKFESNPDDRARYLIATEVFKKCRSNMHEDAGLCSAIDGCLNHQSWIQKLDLHAESNELAERQLRSSIYRMVVGPLQQDLNKSHSDIFKNGKLLDENVANDVGFGCWESIHPNRAQGRGASSMVQQISTLPSRPILRSTTAVAGDSFGVNRESNQLPTDSEHLPDSAVEFNEGDAESRFYDDESPGDERSEASQKYKMWSKRTKNVLNDFVPERYEELTAPGKNQRPVKIAVLDTGIDDSHPDMQAADERIKHKQSWVDGDAPDTAPDEAGHGTHVTSLILEYAPAAEVYVAKISKQSSPGPRADVVAKAITVAVNDWKVDMINFSCGFSGTLRKDYKCVREAIELAWKNDVLFFAAASNDGGQRGRAYPARDGETICVNSVDTYGNRSPFTPTEQPDEINLATVGEGVEGAWPKRLSSENKITRCKSGTSIATPIMTGFAAFLLIYVRINLPDCENLCKKRLKMMQLLKRVATKDGQTGRRDKFYYVNVSKDSDSLFGGDKKSVTEALRKLLLS